MESIWNKTAKKPSFKDLSGDSKTDVLIIGGGIAGLLIAYELQNTNVDYMLVEADEICGGITRDTTAKITAGHGVVYSKISKNYGLDAARFYYDAQAAALEKFAQMSNVFECDFVRKDSVVYTLKNREKMEKEAEILNKIGANAEFIEQTELPFKVFGAVRFKNQAQFNPLKFLYKIAQGLNIYENTKVLEIGKNEVVTNKGRIKAQRVIVATHFPFINKHGGYFIKMYQHRSYVLALENAKVYDAMYVDECDKGLSFRNYGQYLLLGGGGHRTGKNGGNWNELHQIAKKYYPKAHELCRFATQDCITPDRIPYVGKYAKATPNLFVATGFNKWGMTSSMVAAELLCDLLRNKHNIYKEVFSSARNAIHPQIFINLAESAVSLLKPTSPRCPHMGCALKYNKAEHSWDCSCHGSRFTSTGKLINNPATDDKKIE